MFTGNVVCPPTDEPTPVLGPRCQNVPEAGPEVCDQESIPVVPSEPGGDVNRAVKVIKYSLIYFL
jgi:hypothetical protein